jgi:hypothetical protein
MKGEVDVFSYTDKTSNKSQKWVLNTANNLSMEEEVVGGLVENSYLERILIES